jgi:hypothetical protein
MKSKKYPKKTSDNSRENMWENTKKAHKTKVLKIQVES